MPFISEHSRQRGWKEGERRAVGIIGRMNKRILHRVAFIEALPPPSYVLIFPTTTTTSLFFLIGKSGRVLGYVKR